MRVAPRNSPEGSPNKAHSSCDPNDLPPALPPFSTAQPNSVVAMSGLQHHHHPSSASRMAFNDYQLSDDLNLRFTQLLEKKYGGGARAHRAATLIQRAYRDHRLRQQFEQLTSGGQRQQQQNTTTSGTPLRTSPEKVAKPGTANSQPTLRYQPATSLSSQLRAEREVRQQQHHLLSAGNGKKNSVPSESQYEKPRTLNELMSPRLVQRRIQQQNFHHPSPMSTVFGTQNSNSRNNSALHRQPQKQIVTHPPVTHFHPEIFVNTDAPKKDNQIQQHSDTDGIVFSNSSSSAVTLINKPISGSTAVVVEYQGEDEEGVGEDHSRGYHRSQSPAAFGSNLHVVELQASPGRSSSSHMHVQQPRSQSSPIRHPQPMVNIANGKLAGGSGVGNTARSVWVPRQFVTTSPTLHQQLLQQQQLQMRQQQYSPNGGQYVTQNNIHLQQQHQRQPRTSITRASSTRSAVPYHTSSLPRMASCRETTTTTAMERCRMAAAPTTITTAEPQATANGDLTSAKAVSMRVEWTEQQRRRLYRIALNFFNKKPERGVQLLVAWGFVLAESPRALARLFLERRGLSKQMIGEYLGTLKSPFHAAVLDYFIEQIPMYEMEIDVALRQLLKHFRLPGEAQKIDHIIQAFARRYLCCNPTRLGPQDTPDTIYILAFAVIMLNTDLHTPSLKDSRRMKLDEFVRNLHRVEEGRHLNRQLLVGIYERVKQYEFQAGTDHTTQVLKVDQAIISKDKPKLVEPHRRLICYCRLHQITDANKRQSASAHQRDIFLFNDAMLVCKLVGGRRRSSGMNGSGAGSAMGQYQLRSWSPLIGLHVEEFQNSLYSHGMVISCADGQVLMFNAKNADDRFRFIADIRESVAECTEMEQWRLELELDKQQQHALGARLADHGFHLSSGQQMSAAVVHHHPDHGFDHSRHSQAVHQPLPPHPRLNSSSIGSTSQSSGGGTSVISVGLANTTLTTTSPPSAIMTDVQRDSGLPDMDHTSHSRSSHSSSPVDFT